MMRHLRRWVAIEILVVFVAACATLAPSSPNRSEPAHRLVRVDSVQLMADLRFLASDSLQGRLFGSPGGAVAASYVEQRFRTLGLQGGAADGGYRQVVPGGDRAPGSNVIARISGSDHPDFAFVLTAHYDHLGVRGGDVYNGADDNASGTSALLAIAAYYAAHPPKHTILFAALDGEEGGLRGARAFVANPPIPLRSVLLNVNMDMVSRHDFGEIWVSGTAHDPFLIPLVEAAVAGSAVPVRFGHDTGSGHDNWTSSSDHAAFHREGIPFLYFGVEDHVDYHRPTDDASKVEPGFFVGSVQTILGVVRSLDGANEALSAVR